MNEEFHVIIAGDQRSPFSFKISRKRLLIITTGVVLTAFCLAFTGLFTGGLYGHNRILAHKAASSRQQSDAAAAEIEALRGRLDQLVAEHRQAIEALRNSHNLEISRIELESNKRIAALEKKNLEQEMSFKEERDLLLSTAVSELNARSEFIENVISDIGIKIKPAPKSSRKNSGGPFVAAENAVYDELIYRTDQYLKTLQSLPLGRPVKGSVSSWFGKRKDPLNDKNAFHEGVDLRGKRGEPVLATADGKVVFAGTNGGYGKYVKIDHGNGYATSFAHLQNYHVKKGDYISRGQTIGLVGNTGRSTGTHLHYEITFKGKPVNPHKFMQIAERTCKLNISPEN